MKCRPCMVALEVYMGPDLALRPCLDTARGSGLKLVVQLMFGSVPDSDVTNQALCTAFRAFSGRYFFAKKNYSQLRLSYALTLSGSGYKSHRPYFLGNLPSCALPEKIRANILQIWRLLCLYRSSNTKITSGILSVSLNNSFKHYWHLCIKKIY